MNAVTVSSREYIRVNRKKLLAANITTYLSEIEQVMQALQAERLRASTLRAYRSYLNLFAAWLVLFCQSKTFREVTVEDLRVYIAFLMEDQGLAANTINAYLAAIRKMFHVIREEELSKRTLPDLVVDVHLPRVPSVEEVSIMLEACVTSQELLLIAILVTTGMRISEVVHMRFRDIEKAQKQILVPESKGRIAGYVPLSPETVTALTGYCNAYNTQHPLNPLTRDDFVFFNEDRTSPLSLYQIRKIYNGIQSRSKLTEKHYTFHKLRHYFGLHLYLQSHDLVLVKTLLRHKTIAATLIYVVLAASIDVQTRYRNPGDLAFAMMTGRKENAHGNPDSATDSGAHE